MSITALDSAAPAGPRQRVERRAHNATSGFPSPSDDYLERGPNLHEYCVRRPTSTYFFRVDTSAFAPRVQKGDLLVVDRAQPPQDASLVVMAVEGELQLHRYRSRAGRRWLERDEPGARALSLGPNPESPAHWGTVMFVVGQLERVVG